MRVTTKFDQLKYYQSQTVKVMNAIEDATSTMMQDLDPQLEKNIWESLDRGNIKDIRKYYLTLCRLHDTMTMDTIGSET